MGNNLHEKECPCRKCKKHEGCNHAACQEYLIWNILHFDEREKESKFRQKRNLYSYNQYSKEKYYHYKET